MNIHYSKIIKFLINYKITVLNFIQNEQQELFQGSTP